jgi:hypothetical protein
VMGMLPTQSEWELGRDNWEGSAQIGAASKSD